jgi:hypothetical protein
MKRRRRPDVDWPAGLARFSEAAWIQADDDLDDASPEQRAVWRWIFAHRRWRDARAEWLKANGQPWLDLWIADVRAEHRRRETLRA